MTGVNQFFIEDMDLDGSTDIVTNDQDGRVTVFYGETAQSGPTYLSQTGTHCDDDRQTRVQDNSTLIRRFGIELQDDLAIVDDSLVRRS